MKVYAIFNPDGTAKGFYPEDIWPTPPSESKEITIEEWSNIVSSPQKFKLVKGKISSVSVTDEVYYSKTISDRQFYQQLSVDGIISQKEALSAVKSGELPAAILSLMKNFPEDQLFNAEMLLSGATTFQIENSLTEIFFQALGWEKQKLIQFWINASKL